jgi:hypothetical protein
MLLGAGFANEYQVWGAGLWVVVFVSVALDVAGRVLQWFGGSAPYKQVGIECLVGVTAVPFPALSGMLLVHGFPPLAAPLVFVEHPTYQNPAQPRNSLQLHWTVPQETRSWLYSPDGTESFHVLVYGRDVPAPHDPRSFQPSALPVWFKHKEHVFSETERTKTELSGAIAWDFGPRTWTLPVSVLENTTKNYPTDVSRYGHIGARGIPTQNTPECIYVWFRTVAKGKTIFGFQDAETDWTSIVACDWWKPVFKRDPSNALWNITFQQVPGKSHWQKLGELLEAYPGLLWRWENHNSTVHQLEGPLTMQQNMEVDFANQKLNDEFGRIDGIGEPLLPLTKTATYCKRNGPEKTAMHLLSPEQTCEQPVHWEIKLATDLDKLSSRGTHKFLVDIQHPINAISAVKKGSTIIIFSGIDAGYQKALSYCTNEHRRHGFELMQIKHTASRNVTVCTQLLQLAAEPADELGTVLYLLAVAIYVAIQYAFMRATVRTVPVRFESLKLEEENGNVSGLTRRTIFWRAFRAIKAFGWNCGKGAVVSPALSAAVSAFVRELQRRTSRANATKGERVTLQLMGTSEEYHAAMEFEGMEITRHAIGAILQAELGKVIEHADIKLTFLRREEKPRVCVSLGLCGTLTLWNFNSAEAAFGGGAERVKAALQKRVASLLFIPPEQLDIRYGEL